MKYPLIKLQIGPIRFHRPRPPRNHAPIRSSRQFRRIPFWSTSTGATSRSLSRTTSIQCLLLKHRNSLEKRSLNCAEVYLRSFPCQVNSTKTCPAIFTVLLMTSKMRLLTQSRMISSKRISVVIHLTHSTLNMSSFGGQIRMRYRREKQVILH